MKKVKEKVEVNEELLRHIAKLARLKLEKKELAEFLPQLKEILDYFKIIDEAELDKVKPSVHPVELKNRARKDIVKKSLPQELVLSLSLHHQDGYFKGPRVM